MTKYTFTQTKQIRFMTVCKYFANAGQKKNQIKNTFALCEMPHLYDQFSTGLEIQLKMKRNHKLLKHAYQSKYPNIQIMVKFGTKRNAA